MKLKSSIADHFSNKSFDQLRSAYQQLQEENRLLRENGIQQAKDLGQDIKRLSDALEALESTSSAEIESKVGEIASLQQSLKAKEKALKEAEEESELLLLQLHQVQEELESVFLKEQESQQQLQAQTKLAQEQSKQIQALDQEKSKLALNLDEQAKINQQHQANIEALNQTNATLSKDKDAQLALAQSNLKQVESLTSNLEKMKSENNALKAELAQSKEVIEVQLKEVQGENELLLLQLHQVQEELEHYFLEFQRLQRENESLQGRWQRLEDRLPNYLDFESIAPTAIDPVASNPHIEWCVKDVLIGGEIIPEFKFITFLEDGLCGISLLSGAEYSESEPVRLTPRALLKPKAVAAIAEFRNMSAAHWRQMKVAVSCVEQFFKDPARASGNNSLPPNFDLVFWRQISMPLIADIMALPPVFRFNQVKLKRELIHADYEHLWLEIHDATYGDTHWPKIELRLGAANIQPGAFSRYPKIEIPRIDGKTRPFASWFEESFDDFGPKLELRFDLNKQLFDLGVWIKLGQLDQLMLLSLLGALPIFLKRLEDNKTAIARPWDSWMGLASSLLNVLRKRLKEADEVLKKQVSKKAVDETPKAEAPLDETQANIEEKKEGGSSAQNKSQAVTTKPDKKSVADGTAEKSTAKKQRYVGARPKKSRGR